MLSINGFSCLSLSSFSESHEWINVQGSTALIGITEHAQNELGDIVYLELTEIGKELAKEESFGSIESVKAVSELYMPISGKITKINQELINTPETINTDPYDKAWIIEIDITKPEELDALMNHNAYEEFINLDS